MSYNRYGYELNNPLRFVDPSGYFAEGDSTGKAQGSSESMLLRLERKKQQEERLSYATDESRQGPSENQIQVMEGGAFVLGPIGVGLTISYGWPDWLVGRRIAAGLDIGIVADNRLFGIGVYLTTKKPHSNSNPISFAIAPEIMYAQSFSKRQINIDNLKGQSVEFMGGAGPLGFSYGFDVNNTYQVFTGSTFGKGIDVGYGTWDTQTKD